MNYMFFFPDSEAAVEIDSNAECAFFYRYMAEGHHVCQMFGGLTLSDLVVLAKAVLDLQAASDYDQFLIAQYAEKQDAQADAVGAEWGND